MSLIGTNIQTHTGVIRRENVKSFHLISVLATICLILFYFEIASKFKRRAIANFQYD